MPFEVFSKRAAGRIRQPTITVQKRGTLGLNSAGAAFLAGGDPPDVDIPVELLFDRERQIIGIRRAIEESMHSSVYMLRKQRNSDSYLLSGKAFTQYYGIKTGDHARRYIAKDLGDGILGAELEGEFDDVTREEATR